MNNKLKILVSGGGTGGHIFPAVAIVEALGQMADIDVLFVGANGRMEMEKIPALGYKIEGLNIAGFQRGMGNIWKNIFLPFKVISSLVKVFNIINTFKPDLAIGTGGYASAPTLKMAQWLSIPTFIQEQNAQPGYTNRILGNQVKAAFVSFEESKSYFKHTKCYYTGNAIRESFAEEKVSREAAYEFFKLDPNKKTVFVTGGSLGSDILNRPIAAQIEEFNRNDIQLLWQTGKNHLSKYKHLESETCRVFDFISNMQMAYAAADIIVTRAGGVLFELFVIGKPVIALPSSFVADDHQTPNAQALVDRQAGWMIKDSEANELLISSILRLIHDESQMKMMSQNISLMAKPKAASEIAGHILELYNKR